MISGGQVLKLDIDHSFFSSRIWIWTRRFLLLGLALAIASVIFRPRFTPRDAGACIAAIGSLDALSDEQKRFFMPAGDFGLLGTPRQGDWLYQFPELGQTWEQYMRSGFNRFAPPRNRLYLQPLGAFSTDSMLLERLRSFTEEFYAAEVVLLPPVDLASQTFRGRINAHTGKPQVRTGDILDWLRARLPDDAYCLTAITMTDLYPNDSWNFVFGEATLVERVGVFSFSRYDPAFHGQPRGPDYESLMLRRCCKVLAHEIGHIYGLYHCVHYQCLMNGSNSLQESDSRPLHECPVCLRKFWSNIQFSPGGRYQNLQRWYRAVGFADEAEWISRRLHTIQGRL